MEMLYRIIFKNGTFSAWSSDKESIFDGAKFFGGKIETWDRENKTHEIIRL